MFVSLTYRVGEEILSIGQAPIHSDRMTTESAIKAADVISHEFKKK